MVKPLQSGSRAAVLTELCDDQVVGQYIQVM
jgi:hypothetical protein